MPYRRCPPKLLYSAHSQAVSAALECVCTTSNGGHPVKSGESFVLRSYEPPHSTSEWVALSDSIWVGSEIPEGVRALLLAIWPYPDRWIAGANRQLWFVKARPTEEHRDRLLRMHREELDRLIANDPNHGAMTREQIDSFLNMDKGPSRAG